MIADEIKALADEHCAAFRAKDPAAITRIYAEDVKKFDDKGGLTVGRATLTAEWMARFPHLEGALGMKTVDLAEMTAGDLVAEIGEWTMDLTQPQRSHASGRYFAVYQRQADGALRITFEFQLP
jgi:ketosteroid isomerase-like protein